MWQAREGQAGFSQGQFKCDVENGESVSSVNEGALTDEQARIDHGSIKNRYRWIQNILWKYITRTWSLDVKKKFETGMYGGCILDL